MDNTQIEKNFETYINLLETKIKRDGMERLIKWLKARDTKVAPASAKYHCAYAGGLVEHSLNVYERLKKLVNLQYPIKKVEVNGKVEQLGSCPYSDETIALVALLHDISKVGFYSLSEKNVKNENGEWVKEPVYVIKPAQERVFYGSHSENSCYMLSKFINLDNNELLAIRYHMGGYDNEDDRKRTSDAWLACPLALLLHQADAQATYLDETQYEQNN